MYEMYILMSSNYLVFKSFSFEVIYSLVWPALTKPRLGFSKQVNWVFCNFSKCKNVLYIKCRSWWVEQTCYSWLSELGPSRVPKTCVAVKIEISKFKWSKPSQMKSWPLHQMCILIRGTKFVFMTFASETISGLVKVYFLKNPMFDLVKLDKKD